MNTARINVRRLRLTWPSDSGTEACCLPSQRYGHQMMCTDVHALHAIFIVYPVVYTTCRPSAPALKPIKTEMKQTSKPPISTHIPVITIDVDGDEMEVGDDFIQLLEEEEAQDEEVEDVEKLDIPPPPTTRPHGVRARDLRAQARAAVAAKCCAALPHVKVRKSRASSGGSSSQQHAQAPISPGTSAPATPDHLDADLSQLPTAPSVDSTPKSNDEAAPHSSYTPTKAWLAAAATSVFLGGLVLMQYDL